MLRNYCITLLTLKNEIVARLQQPFAGPSIVVKREQQQALEQVVMQVPPPSLLPLSLACIPNLPAHRPAP